MEQCVATEAERLDIETVAPVAGPGEPAAPATAPRPQNPINRVNFSFLVFAHLMAVAAVLYLVFVKFSWWTLGLGALWSLACGLSITGGYHRLFSHGSYRAGVGARLFYLLFGAASVQNSALKWSSDHRMHHSNTDREGDPYDSTRGFWWSHVGWVIFRDAADDVRDNVADLERSSLVRLQHRHYVALAIVMGGVVPLLLGLLWGDPIGALLVAGFLRLVLQWHSTFSINSVAHLFGGKRPFAPASAPRESFWLARFTLGEG
ncbi:MAG: fatty acid desaturase [Planctomycetota bacterium]